MRMRNTVMASAGELEELCQFLTPSTRLDVKSTALDYVLGLTGSVDGIELVKKRRSVLKQLLDLTMDTRQPMVSRDAHLTLLNASADKELAKSLLELDVVPRLLEFVANPEWVEADKVCTILSNLTSTEEGAATVVKALTADKAKVTLHQLVDIFGRMDFNKNANFHYLATLFSNISQLSAARLLFLDRQKCIVPQLLPFTQADASVVRRGGVVGLLRNLCFEVDSHRWLLSDEVDILPSLLLPLAGGEQFEEEEMEKLPEDLQYLPDDKKREGDPDIRKMLIEAIMKLCSTKAGRHHLRERQVYLILRELDKWETDEGVQSTCLKLISILISDEPAPDMEALHQVEVPARVAAQIENVESREHTPSHN